MEWYDFALDGFSPPSSAPCFSPADPVAQLLAAFGVFAVGYLMRPVGSALFGVIGDRLGRARAAVSGRWGAAAVAERAMEATIITDASRTPGP
jgi:MFS transporter, MHS family, proline/betaine transporter